MAGNFFLGGFILKFLTVSETWIDGYEASVETRRENITH